VQLESSKLHPFYSRDNEDGFHVDSKTGEITWKHFDAGQGLKLRMIYTNSASSKIFITGYAVNARIINYTKRANDRITQARKVDTITVSALVGLIIMALILIIDILFGIVTALPNGMHILKEAIRVYIRRRRGIWEIMSLIVGCILAVAMMWYVVGLPSGPLPVKPF
jgi:hypothetical protein